MLLDDYETTCRAELKREHPNVESLIQLQEYIEDEADEMGIAIMWETMSTGPVATLHGDCFGIYHMPFADPDKH